MTSPPPYRVRTRPRSPPAAPLLPSSMSMASMLSGASFMAVAIRRASPSCCHARPPGAGPSADSAVPGCTTSRHAPGAAEEPRRLLQEDQGAVRRPVQIPALALGDGRRFPPVAGAQHLLPALLPARDDRLAPLGPERAAQAGALSPILSFQFVRQLRGHAAHVADQVRLLSVVGRLVAIEGDVVRHVIQIGHLLVDHHGRVGRQVGRRVHAASQVRPWCRAAHVGVVAEVDRRQELGVPDRAVDAGIPEQQRSFPSTMSKNRSLSSRAAPDAFAPVRSMCTHGTHMRCRAPRNRTSSRPLSVA